MYTQRHIRGYMMMQHLHRRFLTPCRKAEWEILKRTRMDLTSLIMSFIFSLDKTNSNYPLENFVFQDYLKHSSNATDSKHFHISVMIVLRFVCL